jgi:hypothetical protein
VAAEDGLSGSDWLPYGAVARRLRDAHRRVAALPPEVRPEATHRLIKITDLAKRDLARAAEKLDAFMAELNRTNGDQAGNTPHEMAPDDENPGPTR